MVPVSSVVASTQWLCWEVCTCTQSKQEVSDKKTNVGRKRGTIVLVPEREREREKEKESDGGTPKAELSAGRQKRRMLRCVSY